ncbi:MAG TPA: hemolysin family protein [Dehalococcoidia bacterium]|nr:hemolysin family protein [Dehalococcoidia bacterium]
MSNMDILYLVLFFVCLLFSAFFASSETAFISLQRLRLRHLARTEHADSEAARQVATIAEKPERFLATVLVGNNLVNTAAAALATILVASALTEGQAVLVTIIGVTIVLLVFGEVFPKIVGTRLGMRLAMLYATPMKVLIWVLSPVAAVFLWIADKLARLIGASPVTKMLTSEAEIRTAVSVGVEEGSLEESEADMVEAVFRFGDRLVSEVMTPRPSVTWVEKGTTIREFLSIYAQTPHSRFPVYEDTRDKVVGVLWIKDLLMAQAKGSCREDSPIDELLRPVHFVPENKLVAELFAELQKSGDHLSMVADEFGGVAGMVTVEQLLEEIVGELQDELTKTRKSFETVGENSFQIDGGMRIEDANEKLELGLPEGPYETVAGFVLDLLGHIPKEGEQLKHDKLKMVITAMKGLKIEKILVTKEKDAVTTQLDGL